MTKEDFKKRICEMVDEIYPNDSVPNCMFTLFGTADKIDNGLLNVQAAWKATHQEVLPAYMMYNFFSDNPQTFGLFMKLVKDKPIEIGNNYDYCEITTR